MGRMTTKPSGKISWRLLTTLEDLTRGPRSGLMRTTYKAFLQKVLELVCWMKERCRVM